MKLAQTAIDSPAIDHPSDRDPATLDRVADVLDTLPPLTRTIFLLSAIDNLSYEEIGWRVRLSTDEIKERMIQGLCRVDCYREEGDAPLTGRIRRALYPLRAAWYAARHREGERIIARWLPPDRQPGRRTMLDWIVVILSV